MGQNSTQIQLQKAELSSAFHLGPDDVHIWWGSLSPEVEPASLHPLPADRLLAEDEMARAARFYFERDRLRYITGRAGLRQLLGIYTGLDPKVINFEYTFLGKPGLKVEDGQDLIQFNLSNSGDRVLYAFSLKRLVGIDLELVHPMADIDDFAAQFFCASECALLSALSGSVKLDTFFELWTCKEALLKAMGDGLTRPINEVEIELSEDGPRLISIGGDCSQADDWQIRLFQPAPGYQAALAVEGRNWRSNFFSFSPLIGAGL